MCTRTKLLMAFAAALFLVSPTSGLLAGIANPDFEMMPAWPIPMWATLGNPGEAPPPSTGTNCARLEPKGGLFGPGFGLGGGFLGSGMLQNFTCDPAQNDKCFILFDFGHFDAGGSLAGICVDGPAGPLWGIIPPLAPYNTALFIYPECDSLQIFFGIVQPGAAAPSNLYIDNIRDTCCLECIDTTGILVMELADSPPADSAGASVGDLYSRLGGTRVPSAHPWAIYVLIIMLIATGTYVVIRNKTLKSSRA